MLSGPVSPQSDALELWIVNLEGKEGVLERVPDCIPVRWVPPEQVGQEVQKPGHGDIPRGDDLLQIVKRQRRQLLSASRETQRSKRTSSGFIAFTYFLLCRLVAACG